MSMFRPMHEELFKYRKRKKVSLDGSVPGVPYAHFRRSRRHISGMPYIPGRPTYHHDFYNTVNHKEYHPRLNAPAVQSEEYSMNEDWDSHEISHSMDSKLFRPFPELPATEEIVTHAKSREVSEFFLKVMEVMYQPFEEGQEIPSLADIWKEHCNAQEQDMPGIESTVEDESLDYYPGVTEIGDALAKLSPVLPSDHQDLINLRTAMRELLGFQEVWPELEDSGIGLGKSLETEELTPEEISSKLMDVTDALSHLIKVLPSDHPDVVNLRSAMHDIMDNPEAMSKLESLLGDVKPSKLGDGDPYERDSFEEAEQMVEKQFSEPEMMPIETQAQDMFEYQAMDPEMAFEDSLSHDSFMEQETLEQIVQQEDPFAVAAPGFVEQDMIPNEMLPNIGMPGAMAEPTGYDANMAANEINQAIDHLTGQAMPQEMEMEPDPFQPQYDPFMAPEYMFDPEMQYMMQYMMPGAMPCGPMGPGPMPMPGP